MRVVAVVVGSDGSPDLCAAVDTAVEGSIVHVMTVIDDAPGHSRRSVADGGGAAAAGPPDLL